MSTKKLLPILFLLIGSISAFTQADWQLKSDKDGVKVWIKNSPENPIKQFKLITKAKGHLYQYTNALIDLEKLPSWYDKVASCSVEKVISEQSAEYLITFDLPWPASDRYCQMHGEIIYSDTLASIKTHAYDGDKKSYEGKVRVTDMHSHWTIQQYRPDTVKITHSGHFDPAGWLPDWLVNSAVAKTPKKSVANLISAAPNYPKEIKLPDLQE